MSVNWPERTGGKGAHHRGLFDCGVQVGPFRLVGGQLAEGNVPPVSPSISGVGMVVRGRVDQEVLDGLLGEGGMSLGAGRWWGVSLVLGEALSMRMNMARLVGGCVCRRCRNGRDRRSGRGAGRRGARRGVRRWLGLIHWRDVQQCKRIGAGALFFFWSQGIVQWLVVSVVNGQGTR